MIQAILADAIRNRLNDPRIPPITSITRVAVSDDFALARVFVSVLAPDAQRKLCLAGLQSAAGLLRRILAPELRLRKIPALEFRLDESLRCGFETLAAIDDAMRELGEVPEWEREEAETRPEEGAPDQTPTQGTGESGDAPTVSPSHPATEEDA